MRLFVIGTLAYSTATAQASEIDITIDESIEGQTPTVTALGLSSQTITVQTLSAENWQIDITGDAPAPGVDTFRMRPFLELSEPDSPIRSATF